MVWVISLAPAASAEIKLHDFNHDGNLDIFVTQLASGHFERHDRVCTFLRYFENDGKGNFKDLTTDIFPHQDLNKIFVKPVGRSRGSISPIFLMMS